ncbi:hypothetical protein IL38_24030 [Actinopolyspora erythraea]|uniref:Uncharacterized protein n=1 Tax=Actinopolyspora erythraea TaxID=414996 RepID=A0ABR4WYB4_9ACTN|nr:hypothetical protein [Actinopolyspora erythraea]KGI79370.1 hypothetical protein IL38_24030 [Actinopolyspora erythraea]
MQATMDEENAEAEVDFERLDQLQQDDAIWELPDIAEALQKNLQTVHSWRTKSLKYIRNASFVPVLADVLPEPDLTYTRTPLWRAGTIRTWAMRTGRMLPDGTPVRSKPPGRPRKG